MQTFNVNDKYTPAQRIERAIAQISRERDFVHYMPLLFLGSLKADPECTTAYTDGRNIALSPKFVEWCTEKELNFVLLHEAEHIGLLDFMTMSKQWKEDPQLANAACDYAINLHLYDLCCKYPALLEFPKHKEGPNKGQPFGLLDEQYRDMSNVQIYNLLKQEADAQDSDPQDGDGDGDGDAEGAGDSKQGKPGKSKSKPKAGSGGSLRDHIDTNQWDEHGFDAVDELPSDGKRSLAEDVKEAVTQGGVLASRAGSKTSRKHDAILTREIPWHEVMLDFIKANMSHGDDMTTWRQYKRSMVGQGIYLPSTYSERVNRIVIARDTSGSVGQAMLNAFNGYLVNACEEIRPEEVVVLDWGSRVVNDERYTAFEGYDAIKQRTRVMGGGGTSPESVGAYLHQHNIEADCLIILTDGVFPNHNFTFPMQVPTLWCVVDRYWNNFKVPFGQAVKIKA